MRITIDVQTPDLRQVCTYLRRKGWTVAGADGTWTWFDLGKDFRVEVPMRVGYGGFERQMATLLDDLSVRVEKRSVVDILHDIGEIDLGAQP